jgi:hypothetical protein
VAPRADLDGYGEEKISCLHGISNLKQSSPWHGIILTMLSQAYTVISNNKTANVLTTFRHVHATTVAVEKK